MRRPSGVVSRIFESWNQLNGHVDLICRRTPADQRRGQVRDGLPIWTQSNAAEGGVRVMRRESNQDRCDLPIIFSISSTNKDIGGSRNSKALYSGRVTSATSWGRVAAEIVFAFTRRRPVTVSVLL